MRAIAALCLTIVVGATQPFASETIRIGISELPLERGDPFRSTQAPTVTVTSAFFDSLTTIQADGSVAPSLAVSWSPLNRTTWVFKLREGVTFANGAPFTAESVAWYINYITAPGPATQDVRRQFSFLARARALDQSTLEITTERAMPQLPRYASAMLIPEPKHLATVGLTLFAVQPIGTGPYVVEDWRPNLIQMKANLTSWRKPKASKISIIGIKGLTARLQALQSKQIDLALDLSADALASIEAQGDHSVVWEENAVSAIMLRTNKANPLSSVLVRRALNLAIDRKAIVNVLMGGHTRAANQPATSKTFGFNPAVEPFEFNPAKARALLKQAGYPDGFTFVLETGSTDDHSAAVLQKVAQDLAQISVEMKIDARASLAYLSDFLAGRLHGAAFTFAFNSMPAMDAIRSIELHSCAAARPWYCDERITPLVRSAQSEWGIAKALSLRQKIMQFYNEQAPALYLYEKVGFAGHNSRLEGFRYAFGKIPYRDLEIRTP